LAVRVQDEVAVCADVQLPGVDLLLIGAEFRLFQDMGGELVEQLIEAAVGVAELLRLVGRPREVGPAQAAEERLEEALLEQLLGRVPVVLAGAGQFVETATGAAGGEDEGAVELLRADGDRAGAAAGVSV